MPDYELQQLRNLFLRIKSQSPTATNLLSSMCMLDKQSIPAIVFFKEFDIDQDAEAAMGILIKSAIVKEYRHENVYVIDPSVQVAIRELVQEMGDTDKAKEKALNLVWDYYTVCDDKEWDISAAMEPHAQVVLSYNYDSPRSQLHQAWILNCTAQYAYDQGKLETAEEEIRRNINILSLHSDALNLDRRYSLSVS